ncbi:substrate-binding periplasmic protein [Pseudomonas kuykendallii]|uniref:Bifunctional lytic transglycosylase/amino acid ABC transporter substrate-binding protein n=1 Tax=Pseudomonas kuykendallii TaxID=1007099 RepID=A0A2W5DA46_9PSED|nr:transporter substrate-binding domain-containing protein [Pseudomonas kuykendallii]PZP25300.1 MAG: bifunctional lytic transglycosylase/amino acid ABC transporter substrate-binding protein [Pseudomonas kuykendallii]
MSKPPRLLLPLLGALFCGACFAGRAPEPPQPLVKVGYYNLPPAIYADARGEAQGSLVDLTRQLLHNAGYRVSFRELPSARLYAGLIDGSVDVWPGAPGKPDLVGRTLVTEEQLAEISLNLYYRHGSPAPVFPRDLSARDVILITGYTYLPEINAALQDPTLRQHRTSTHTAALQMLDRGRGDFLLDYDQSVNQAAKELGIATPPSVQLVRVPIKFIISARNANGQKLRDDLDRAYRALRATGADLQLRKE